MLYKQSLLGSCREFAAMNVGHAGRAHENECIWVERLLAFGRQAEIVDPELTTDRTPLRQAPNVQYH